MQKATEEKTIQTLAAVASLSGLSLKKVTTGDDTKEFTMTLAFVGVSAGLVQERFDFERVDMRHTVDGKNGHVDSIEGLQPGDLAETGAEADKEINDAAAAALTEELDGAGGPDTATSVDEGPPAIHLVGEAAAVAKKRR